MKKYFLVARNRENETFTIVKLKDKWFMQDGGLGYEYRANDLEAIDLVTTRFSSAKEMAAQMYKNGYIDSPDVDLFIAKESKLHGNTYLNTYEVIYNPYNNERMASFRDVAKAFLNGQEKDEMDNIRLILDKFCSKTFYNRDFCDFICSELTNVPTKIINYFKGVKRGSRPPYDFKFRESWVLDSYSALRNIIETFNRYDSFEGLPNREIANIDFVSVNFVGRKKIENKLVEEINPNFIAGQLRLFDMENISTDEETLPIGDKIELVGAREDTLDEFIPEVQSKEEEITIIEEPVKEEREVSDSEKKSQILVTLSELPLDIFRKTEEELIIKPDLFPSYESEADCKKVETLLKGRMLSAIYLYVLHNNKWIEANRNCWNTIELEDDIRKDLDKLNKNLKAKKNLDTVFEWSRAYNRSLEFNNMNTMMAETEEAKTFGKKKG